MNCDDTVTTVSSTTSRDSTRGTTVPPTVSPPRSSPDVGRSNHHLHSGESPHSGDCASDEPPCTVPFWESTVEPILGCMGVSLLNINSMNATKFDFLSRYLSAGNHSAVVITELVKEHSVLDNALSNHPRFPTLCHSDTKRVGVMTRKFYEDYFNLVEQDWVLQPSRKRLSSNLNKSEKVCHISVYAVKINTKKFTLVAVYIAPDATDNSYIELFEKLVALEQRFPNVIAMGDYNLDQSDERRKKFVNSHLGGVFKQIVEKTTRRATRIIGDTPQTSETTIDLVFVSHSFADKVTFKKIVEDTPSDHFMVELEIDVAIPAQYRTAIRHQDPTLRPPIRPADLPEVIDLLRTDIEYHWKKIEKLPPSEALSFLKKSMTPYLNQFCPFYKNEPIEYKIYNFPISQATRKLKEARTRALRKYGRIRRNKSNSDVEVEQAHREFKQARNAVTHAIRNEKLNFIENIIDDFILQNPQKAWSAINILKNKKSSSAEKKTLEIKGKTGTELADHMANYLHGRTYLVSDDEISSHADFIPFPENNADFTKSDYKPEQAKELFKKRAGKPSLNCGPDGISHRHVMDLFPAIEKVLDHISCQPIDQFPNMCLSYNRLISKESGPANKKLTEKSQRPIAQLDILPKYGMVKPYINELKGELIPRFQDNQFAMPGKGAPMANVKVFDELCVQIKLKRKILLIFWDFSNAFLCFDRNIAVEFAKKHGISDHLVKLLPQFLDQGSSIIKTHDKDGFYRSKMVTTYRGSLQGQLGSDLIFTMLSDRMIPEKVADENYNRDNYVDDKLDVVSCDDGPTCFKSYFHNKDLLLKQATSMGLKLNPGKEKIMPINFDPSELPDLPIPEGETEIYVTKHKILGFPFSIVKNKISVENAVDACITRLDKGCSISIGLKSISKYDLTNLKAATQMVYSNLYDLGRILPYCTKKHFNQIEFAVKKALKASGLDQCIPTTILYKITLNMTLQDAAEKQIIQLGVKFLDPKKVKNDRFLVKMAKNDEHRPFWSKFRLLFNNLPHNVRVFIIGNLDPKNKRKMQKIKKRLRNFFIKKLSPDGELKDSQKLKLFHEHKFSYLKIQQRKKRAEKIKKIRDYSTPIKQLSRLRGKRIFSLLNRDRAPYAEEIYSLEQGRSDEPGYSDFKRIRIDRNEYLKRHPPDPGTPKSDPPERKKHKLF